MPRSRRLIALAAATTLAGCATPRLYSPLELADVALACKLPTTDLVQEPDLKKILFVYTVAPSRAQLDCVHRWARRNHLHLAFIEAVNQQPEQAQP